MKSPEGPLNVSAWAFFFLALQLVFLSIVDTVHLAVASAALQALS